MYIGTPDSVDDAIDLLSDTTRCLPIMVPTADGLGFKKIHLTLTDADGIPVKDVTDAVMVLIS